MLGRVVEVIPGCEVAVVISVSFVLAVLSVVIMDEVMIVVAGVVVGTPEEKWRHQSRALLLADSSESFEIQFMGQNNHIVLFMQVSLQWLETKKD